MQDQAFLGPESGLAVPAEDGGVDLYVATQWLHVDRGQVADCLGLPTVEGPADAWPASAARSAAREDLSMQVHACMLALRTGRPVKMVYSREESFFGHVHRHPARMRYEHGADRDGRLVYVKARIVLDGGAYASSSPAVVANADHARASGRTRCPTSSSTATASTPTTRRAARCAASARCRRASPTSRRWTSSPPRSASTRSSVRVRNALEPGDTPADRPGRATAPHPSPSCSTGSAPPLPPPAARRRTCASCPAASPTPRTARASAAASGTASASRTSASPRASTTTPPPACGWRSSAASRPSIVHTAAAEVGQGLVTIQAQIVRTELGVEQVTVATADTTVGSAGSSARRRGRRTSPAARSRRPARRSRAAVLPAAPDATTSRCAGGRLVTAGGEVVADLVDVLGDEPIEETVEWRHRPTHPLDPRTGQGDAHVQYAFAAHRAVVDVDVELGLVRGRGDRHRPGRRPGAATRRPSAARSHGGTAQGLGLAVMEEIQVVDGLIRNPSFTDYLIPTILDMPPMHIDVLELGDPDAPYGLRGVGEPPTISSTPAIVAAIRAATGLALNRVPVRPEHLTGT